MFDIIVIGGNLAGATAAINAVLKGASVVLIERNKEPFNPAHCGELIPNTTAELLNLDKIGCYKNVINNMIINIPPREYNIRLNNNKMIIFNRNYVEKEMLKQAEKKGVILKLGTKIINFKSPNIVFLDNKTVIQGKIIIDASGIACQIGRRIGINTKLNPEDIGVCIQSRVQSNFNIDTIKMWYHKPYAPFFYGWVFPFDEKKANIGIGVPGRQKIDLDNMLKKYIKDMTDDNYKIISTFKSCVPLSPPLGKLIKDNVMIVGDAARLVYSESGGGIENALFSGKLAGAIAASYIHGDISSLKTYQHFMRLKLLRLKIGYNRRKKASKNDKKYIRTYQGIYSLLSFYNRVLACLYKWNKRD